MNLFPLLLKTIPLLFFYSPLRKKGASKIYEIVAIESSFVINEQEKETQFSCLWFQNLKTQ